MTLFGIIGSVFHLPVHGSWAVLHRGASVVDLNLDF